MELDGAYDGAEAPELVHPVAQCGLGHDHNVRPLDAAVLVEVGQQADGLEGLAQTLRDMTPGGGHSTAQGTQGVTQTACCGV